MDCLLNLHACKYIYMYQQTYVLCCFPGTKKWHMKKKLSLHFVIFVIFLCLRADCPYTRQGVWFAKSESTWQAVMSINNFIISLHSLRTYDTEKLYLSGPIADLCCQIICCNVCWFQGSRHNISFRVWQNVHSQSSE